LVLISLDEKGKEDHFHRPKTNNGNKERGDEVQDERKGRRWMSHARAGWL